MGKKRPVVKVDRETMRVVAHYGSIHEAKTEYRTRGLSIEMCLRGKARSAYGFLWFYADQPLPKTVKRTYSREEAIDLIRKKQSVMSYAQLSDKSGWTVRDLIKLYDEEKLYRSDPKERRDPL